MGSGSLREDLVFSEGLGQNPSINTVAASNSKDVWLTVSMCQRRMDTTKALPQKRSPDARTVYKKMLISAVPLGQPAPSRLTRYSGVETATMFVQ
jgi:hypothetical protein